MVIIRGGDRLTPGLRLLLSACSSLPPILNTRAIVALWCLWAHNRCPLNSVGAPSACGRLDGLRILSNSRVGGCQDGPCMRFIHHQHGAQRSSCPSVCGLVPWHISGRFRSEHSWFSSLCGAAICSRRDASPVRRFSALPIQPSCSLLQLAHMRSLPSPLTGALCNPVQTTADYALLSSLKPK